jgi:hypothetical protein
MMRLFVSHLEGAHDIGEISVTRTREQFRDSSAAPDISDSSRYVCNRGLSATLTAIAFV